MIAAPDHLACRGMKPSVRPRERHVDAEPKAGPDTALPKLGVVPLGPRQWDRGTGRDILPPMTWCGTIAAGPMCAQLYGGTSLERRGHPAAVWLPHPCLLWGPQVGGNATSPYILGDPQTKGDKLRNGYLSLAFSRPHKWAKMLHHPCILGDPQTKGDKIRIGCLTHAFSGANK